MTNPSQLRGAASAHFLAGGATVANPLVGLLVLIGWAWNVPALKSLVPGLSAMAPNTAVGLILGGVALGLLHPSASTRTRRGVGKACAGALILIGLLTLLQESHLTGLSFQDGLFQWTGWAPRESLPLSAPSTAWCFVLLGAAQLLLGHPAPFPAWRMDTPVILALLVALFEFNGKLHGVLRLADSSGMALREGMELHTSLLLMLLGMGIVCARPAQGLMGQLTRDTLGGFLARRLVPVSILGPTLVGVALELLHRGNFFTLPTQAALFSTVMSLGGMGIVFLSAHALNRIDAERRQASASLQASEERFRGLLETAPDAVLTVDSTGHVRFANAQAEHLLGYPREELIGQEVEQLVPGLLRETHRLPREASRAPLTVERNTGGVTLLARPKSGAELPVDVTLSPFTAPEGETVTAMLRDVTERERYVAGLRAARAEAERERALLQTVVDHAPVGILFVDPTTDEVRINSTLRQMLGVPTNLELARQQYLRRIRHPDGQPVRFADLPSTRALEGHEVAPERYVIDRAQGPLPVLSSAAPLRGPQGEVRGVIVCVQDASAHEELGRLREEYVGLISHDLRTPLQNITLRGQLLLRSLREKRLEREVGAAEALLRNARRMSGMVEELLEGSRLESGQVELHREPLDMSRFLEEVIERSVPPDARERLRLEVATPVPWLPADAPRLERVLVNLLTNALKYSAPEAPVVVRLEQEGGQVRISVKDQGQGLHPEEAARLFTKYYRTHEGKRLEGVGLGLYISRLIIEAHGGHISVESTPGQGATFVLSLPLTQSSREEERQAMPSPGENSPSQSS
ncbi:MAG: ATP-binding protein [Hyalangium sp.]|uniref:sensor histidine kinase n=1 Tax=Hyalangium sp. TaxID=2028555 RepID=UPI00389ABDB9